MSSISLSYSKETSAVQSAASSAASAAKSPTTQIAGAQPDSVDLSPAARAIFQAGQIAIDAKSGTVTTGQATQFFSQLSGIGQQIGADKQADGGTLSKADAQTIVQSESQLGQQIYSDAKPGASSTTGAQTPLTAKDARDIFQTGRVAIEEKAGHLSGSQANQLFSQIASSQAQIQTDQQANGGSLTGSDAQAITVLQNQLSAQIYETAHPGSAIPISGLTNPGQPAPIVPSVLS